ncbi:MAG TPA: class I SAM-dependent methyltransferase [Acidimicrobiales bacterium]|nr:class I SAM-dependent methyltransferase [Acidimicrobiales bacterium]
MTAERTAPARADLDPAEVGAFAFQVWSYKQGEVVSLMIHLGQRLGLYGVLAGAGARSAADVASRASLDERWVREWLSGQAAAGLLVRHDDATFELTGPGAAVLADEGGSLAYAGGAFTSPPTSPESIDALVEGFRTGIGPTYERHGPAVALHVDAMLGPWARLALVPTVLPALNGVVAKLESGATVADVGCGGGTALLAMADAFPASTFIGYDSSRHAVDLAEANLASHRGASVTFRLADGATLPPEPTFDLVLSFDCLHDMTDPLGVARAIRAAIDADGVWLIKDIRCGETWEENQANPMLAMMYGFSVQSCLASATSEPGGAALGTLGLPPSRMEELCRDAGFTRFEVRDFDEPANLYYEVRP